MPDTSKRIRVFVGSPGDVTEERDAVSNVVERLNNELDRDDVALYFQTIRWEKYDHLRDTRFTPQAAIASGIPRPRNCEVAVFIFWRRLGTVLDMTGLEPNGAGARPTGSTWEFYDALESAKTKVLTYRKMAPAPAVRDESSAQFEERQRQEREVHQFFASFRDSEGSFKHNWHNFENLAEFKADLGQQLRIIAREALSESETEAPGGKPVERDSGKPTSTVNPSAQPETEAPPVESTTQVPGEFGQSTKTDSKKIVKPPITRWPRWLIYGVAAVLIGIVGLIAINLGSSLVPKPDLVSIPSRDFSISRHEITFEQYDHYAEETGTRLPDDKGWGRMNRPVIIVSLDEAKAYADWLSDQRGQECRLPSEAEWEYAARAGGSGEYGLGEGGLEITRDNLDDYAWYRANSGGRTQPVGTRKPNAWGLYDMFGNVREWCGNDEMVCGGAWGFDPDDLRAAVRGGIRPFIRFPNVGFRVVCVPHP